jgi:pimeloyl-ACP methyl ester carboxylesterase
MPVQRRIARKLELAKDAAALVEHVGAATVSVVGMSLGGLVAQELAARRPELMDRLVLVATAPAVGTRLGLLGSVLGRAAISGDPGLLFDLNLLLTHGEAYLDERAPEIAAGRASDTDLLALFRAQYCTCHAGASHGSSLGVARSS